MEVKAEALERSIKRTTLTSNLVSIFVAIISALGVGFGFYFTTQSRLDSHNEKIENIESDLENTHKQINEIQIYKGVSSSEMKNLDKKVDKIDEKLDQLLFLQTNKK
jgi:uncharacterized protein HemX